VKIGSLDRRIAILRNGPATDDGYTIIPGELGILAERSSRWQPASRLEQFESMGKEAKSGGSFVIRSDNITRQIVETDKLAYSGKLYEIQGIRELGRRDGIELFVEAADGQTEIDLSGLSPTPPQSDIENRVAALETVIENVEIESGDGLAIVGDEMRVDIDNLPLAPGI
jgi:Phage head-tail joining protein